MKFTTILVDGRSGSAAPGDRVVYDPRSGYVVVHRREGDIQFVVSHKQRPVSRLFVGRGRSEGAVQACAEVYARAGGLAGDVKAVSAAFEGLRIFEVIA